MFGTCNQILMELSEDRGYVVGKSGLMRRRAIRHRDRRGVWTPDLMTTVTGSTYHISFTAAFAALHQVRSNAVKVCSYKSAFLCLYD